MTQTTDIRERVRSFEDACNVLGIGDPEALPELLQPKFDSIVPSHIKAMLKLEIIVAALNEGWQWIPDGGAIAYWPWFWFYTTKEIAGMSKEFAENIHLVQAADVSPVYAGLGFAYSNNVWSITYAVIGPRLALKNDDLAKHCGRQFIELWKEFLFYKI